MEILGTDSNSVYRSISVSSAIMFSCSCVATLTPSHVRIRSSPAYKYESNKYRNMYYRHISEGGWPFSTSARKSTILNLRMWIKGFLYETLFGIFIKTDGWPISDCTSEGLKAVLCLMRTKCIQDGLKDNSLLPISEQRLHKAVNVLLTYQNEDGGKWNEFPSDDTADYKVRSFKR